MTACWLACFLRDGSQVERTNIELSKVGKLFGDGCPHNMTIRQLLRLLSTNPHPINVIQSRSHTPRPRLAAAPTTGGDADAP